MKNQVKQGNGRHGFEAFLIDKHAAQYTGLDDGMPDDYEAWLVELDVDTLIKWADEWGERLKGEK